MRTIFHIGLPKTGSTALQLHLSGQRDALKERGVLYPENPPGFPAHNHAPLAAAISPYSQMRGKLRQVFGSREVFRKTRRSYVGHLRDEVARHRPECLILSAEQMARKVEKPDGPKLIASIAGNAPTFLMYLRRPSARYLALLWEYSKVSDQLPPCKFRAIEVIKSYRAAFPGAEIHARICDRSLLLQGDIVADFFERYLSDYGCAIPSAKNGATRNATASAEAMEIMREYRRHFHAGDNHSHFEAAQALTRLLLKADGRLKAPRPRLRDGVAERVDYSSAGSLALRDRFGLTFPDFDYARLERGDLTAPVLKAERFRDLVVLDDGLQERMLAWLMRTDWAREDAARMEWLRTFRSS